MPRATSALLAAAAVLLLAILALVWPPQGARDGGTLLVLDGTAGPRLRQVYQPLAQYCGELLGEDLDVDVVTTRDAFVTAAPRAVVLLCPDAVAFAVSAAQFEPLAVGRRRAPQNLRPCSVLVSRRAAGLVKQPWLAAPRRTVFGDSLSLVCLVPLCVDGGRARLPAGVVCGDDPYDHRAVLQALVLGAFDYAVVRQWTAETYQEAGRLPVSEWEVRRLSEPLPDIVLLANREVPAGRRLALREGLVTLGRRPGETTVAAQVARAALVGMDLDGFNLLMEPDFEANRRRFGSCWPRTGE